MVLNDGNVKGNPKLVEGKIGSAMRFTGGERIQILSAEELVLKDFTVDTWVKGDEAPNDSKVSIWLSKGRPPGNYTLTWHHTDKKFMQSVMIFTLFTTVSKIKETLNAEEWYNIVGSYDAKKLKIYVNGELSNTRTWAATPEMDGSPLVIGAVSAGAVGEEVQKEGFEGVVDEVKIYNRALTHAEVLQNFETAKALAVEYSTTKLALTWGEIKISR